MVLQFKFPRQFPKHGVPKDNDSDSDDDSNSDGDCDDDNDEHDEKDKKKKKKNTQERKRKQTPVTTATNSQSSKDMNPQEISNGRSNQSKARQQQAYTHTHTQSQSYPLPSSSSTTWIWPLLTNQEIEGHIIMSLYKTRQQHPEHVEVANQLLAELEFLYRIGGGDMSTLIQPGPKHPALYCLLIRGMTSRAGGGNGLSSQSNYGMDAEDDEHVHDMLTPMASGSFSPIPTRSFSPSGQQARLSGSRQQARFNIKRLNLSRTKLSFSSNNPLEDEEGVMQEYLSEALLREITGEEDLANVTLLDIIINTTENSVADLGKKLPNLLQLKLNNSIISTIRDLGTSLSRLQVLWIARCSLRELEGIAALPELRELYVAFNDIMDISPLAFVEKLQILDLDGNAVEDINQVHWLADCKHLHSLTLDSNPVALKNPERYRSFVINALPQLETLDDVPITEQERIQASSVSKIGTAATTNESISSNNETSEEREKQMITDVIKYARLDTIDEGTVAVRPGSAANGRVGTAASMRSSFTSLRPFSRSGISGMSTSSVPVSRIATAARPATARPSSAATIPRMPGSAAVRPGTARPKDQPTAAAVLSTSRTEVDSSSDLTFGTKQIFAGNLVKSLRTRKIEATAQKAATGSSGSTSPPTTVPENSTLADVSFDTTSLDLLQQVRAWKLDNSDAQHSAFSDEEEDDYDGIGIADLSSTSSFFTSETIISQPLEAIPLVDDEFAAPTEEHKPPRSSKHRKESTLGGSEYDARMRHRKTPASSNRSTARADLPTTPTRSNISSNHQRGSSIGGSHSLEEQLRTRRLSTTDETQQQEAADSKERPPPAPRRYYNNDTSVERLHYAPATSGSNSGVEEDLSWQQENIIAGNLVQSLRRNKKRDELMNIRKMAAMMESVDSNNNEQYR